MFLKLLTVAFIVLKLTHQIDWSWFYVLLPLFFQWIIVAVIFISLVVIKTMKEKQLLTAAKNIRDRKNDSSKTPTTY